MKNAFTKIFILLICLSSARAQVSDDTPFRFGIQFSPNISYISTDDPGAETSSLLRFGYGLMAEYHFAQNYALSTGINIVNRGGRLTDGDNQGNFEGNYKAGFLQIPIRLKMSTREFGYMTYFAEFGGSIDVGISERVSFDPDLPAAIADKDSYVRPLNLMFAVGGGTEYSLGGRTALVAGLYYNRSLVDNINDDDGDIPGVDGDNLYRFDYVSLKLGVLF